jgi:hypothetical protein
MGHLTKWLFFNLMFGAIPYGLTVALNRLQSPDAALLHPSSEVLFIAVVATSSALGELWDGGDDLSPRHERRWRARWQLVLLLGVLLSSLLYGAYVYATLGEPGRVQGVDCSFVATWTPAAGARDPWKEALVSRWGGVCAPWMRSQALFFQCSLWMTGIWVVISTGLTYRYPPRRW